MNEPASKEPSMDEILSSIRQIIADDDLAGNVPATRSNAAKPEGTKPEAAKPEAAKPEGTKPEAAKPEAAKPETAKRVPESAAGPDQGTRENAAGDPVPEPAPAEPAKVADAPGPAPPAAAAPASPVEQPLALSAEQIVGGDEAALDEAVAEAEAQLTAQASKETQLVVPNDIGFDSEDGDVAGGADRDPPAAAAEHPSPLPDPDLSGDLADQLLTPTADAATRHAFNQLNALALSGKERTVEDLIREMLRPMLKSWLDENLPGMVERMVQREIERVSRGER